MKRRELLKAAGVGAAALGSRGVLPAAAAPARPNILFLFPDQHRLDWTSMEPGIPDITPNLKALAGEGVNFRLAFSPSPLCAPARACLASGMQYRHCRVASNGQPYPLDLTTFYSLMRGAGYHVLGCGKFDLDKPGMTWGPDGQHARPGKPSLLEAWGFSRGIDNEGKMDAVSHYKAHPDRPGPYFRFLEQRGLVDAHLKNIGVLDHDYAGPSLVPDDAYCDNWIGNNGLELIDQVPRGEPWFLQVNFDGPHAPMDITKSMYERWKGTEFPRVRDGKAGARRDWPAARRNYGAMIWNIDAWLPRFQEALRRRGELERTIIVYSSDHGDMLGDRGQNGKTQPWEPSVGVPLVVAGPGVRRGAVCNDAVGTLDLTATFLDYAGVARPAEMESRSMRPYLEGTGALPRAHVTSALGRWRLVCDGRYKLISGEGNGGDQLYDLREDAHEETDLAAQRPEVVKRLQPLLPEEGKPG